MVEEEIEIQDLEETIGYTLAYAQIYNVGKKEGDRVKEIKDPKDFLVISLARVSAQAAGRYPSIIQQSLEPANQAPLAQFCSRYGCTIV